MISMEIGHMGNMKAVLRLGCGERDIIGWGSQADLASLQPRQQPRLASGSPACATLLSIVILLKT
jgi:hypothetical protein